MKSLKLTKPQRKQTPKQNSEIHMKKGVRNSSVIQNNNKVQ